MKSNIPKIHKRFILISLILAACVLIPLFKTGIYNGHDLQFHMSRFDGIVQALQDHQFPLALYPLKNYGYGYASPLFYSDIFLVFPAVAAYFFNISPVTIYKIVVAIFVLLFIYSIIVFTYNISNNSTSSILAAIITIFSNYYLTDMYVRYALGEIMAFSFIPFLLWNVYRLVELDANNWMGIGISFSLVLYCHNIAFILCVIMFGIMLIINYKKFLNKEKIILLLKATSLGLCLSMGFLLPMIEQLLSQDFMLNHIQPNMMKDHALSIKQLFSDFFLQFNFSLSNANGLKIVDDDKTIGLLILIVPFLYVFNVKKSKTISNYMLIAYMFIMLSTKLTSIYKLSFLSFMQFPSRFYIVSIPLLSFVIASISFTKKKTIFLLTVLFAMFNTSFLYSTITNKNDVVLIPENVTNYELYTLKKYAKPGSLGSSEHREEVENGEYLPYKYDMNYLTAGNCIDFTSNEHAICSYERTGSKIDFYTNFENDEYIMLPITWYKGYSAYEIDLNGQIMKNIEVFSEEYTGRVLIKASKGQHHYYVYYKGTKLQKISNLISIGSVIFIVLFFLNQKNRTTEK